METKTLGNLNSIVTLSQKNNTATSNERNCSVVYKPISYRISNIRLKIFYVLKKVR